MGFLDYMFDNDRRQRDDLDEVDTRTADLSVGVAGLEGQVRKLQATVGELSATVRVLMRKLAQAGQLDLETIKTEVSAEIRQPRTVTGERVKTSCVRCGTAGWSDELVRVGADIWCRPCARNP